MNQEIRHYHIQKKEEIKMAKKKILLKKFNDFKDCIDFYRTYRKNEYEIKGGIVTPHNSLLSIQGFSLKEIPYPSKKNAKLIIREDAIQRFHPNNINNKEFWTYAKQKFPKFSVCGSKSKNIKECNELTLHLAKISGIFHYLEHLIEVAPQKLNLLEIGYGHGNIFFEIKDKVNYVGIDFYKIKKLNKYKNLMTIDVSGIPDSIKSGSYDIVYSVNVLQHCSQNDRFQYIEQASDKLKTGGYFLGSCLIQCKENDDSEVWGIEDVNGRKYCNFFNQLTEVDTLVEFTKKINEVGFKLIDYKMGGVNTIFFVLKKIN